MINIWNAPTFLPPVIDYPEDYLPEPLPPADLILSFGEHKGIAELLPDIAEKTGAKAVLAAIDSEAWLPRGLARQLLGWLKDMEVAWSSRLSSLDVFSAGPYRLSKRRDR